jgi:hypothetical protein
MRTYGICTNRGSECSLSYESDALVMLEQLLTGLSAREFEHKDTGLVQLELVNLKNLFQPSLRCRECGFALQTEPPPMPPLAPDDWRYVKAVRLTEALNLRDELLRRHIL